VFLIDRSGSMVDTFDRLRYEIIRSVAGMTARQRFHVVLFSDGVPIESPPRRLVEANLRNKRSLAGFLKEVRAAGQTDPEAALKRAFAVLARAQRRKGDHTGQLVHLLTDGVFPDNARALALIRRLNVGKKIRINTYLYGHCPPEAERVMKAVARDSGGRYKYVRFDR